MCRSSREPGGPRRCPAHGRAQLEASLAAVEACERRLGELERIVLERCGIRVGGWASTTDYPVIAARADNPESWGFYRSGSGGRVDLWADLDDGSAEAFLDGLSAAERAAITDYTGGWSGEIVAAMAGDPSAAPQAVGMAATLAAVLARYRRGQPVPAVVARGVPVPEPFDPQTFLDAAFPLGGRVDLTAVASATHNLGIAIEFADHASSYLMVVNSPALPIRPVSTHPWEDESLLAPSRLRCVHLDRTGAATCGIPAVYLVDESLVALAQRSDSSAAGRTVSLGGYP